MSEMRLKITLMGLLFCHASMAQKTYIPSDSISPLRIISMNQRMYQLNDSVIINSGLCKVLKRTVLSPGTLLQNGPSRAPIPFLTLHGNIQYDFLYRSFVDTPLAQKDFRQHSIKTTFSLLFRNLYPVQVTLLHRNTNSPYFRDITDVSIQFSHKDYLKHIKQNLVDQATRQLKVNYQVRLNETELRYKAKLAEVEALQNWLSSPARLQELVAEKERVLKLASATIPVDSMLTQVRGQLPIAGLPAVPALSSLPTGEAIMKAIADKVNGKLTAAGDSVLAQVDAWLDQKKKVIADSVRNSQTAEFINKKKKELDIAKKEAADIEKKIKGATKSISDSLLRIRQEIAGLRDAGAVKNFIKQKKLSAKELPKGWEGLAAIRTAGVGRSWVDYSELTVKNISLTGGHIEVNPGNFYFAAAAGRINYRFRDFIINNSFQPKQSLYLLRGGFGKKEGNNFIVTWYDGKRNLLNPYNITTSVATLERVIGMSAETRIQLNEHQYIVAEFAKSSFHTTGTVNAGSQTLFQKVRNFRDHSNEAYSIRLNSFWPAAGTRISGYYRKMGQNFQSFNLQPVNSVQEAFQVKLQQQLFKKKLMIDAGIRKNDFSNPFINPGVSSSTVFKSLQLSLRVPKYPFITIGYAPSSQLTVLDNQRLVENQYNTLNAVLSHSYIIKQLRMVTNAMFLKFYNHSPDTGFIYYNASSFTVNQFLYLGGWQFQSGLTVTDQQELRVLTLDQSVTYQFKQWLSLTGGLKYNRVTKSADQWGATAGVNMILNKLGTIQLMYDKSYLPGTGRNLLPVETGRVSYFRSF